MTDTFRTAPTKSINVNGTKFVYREFGKREGIPVIFLHHLTAVLEDWDPRVIDGVAAQHHVVIFDNRGVGGSAGTTPTSINEMAADAVAFIKAHTESYDNTLRGLLLLELDRRHVCLLRRAGGDDGLVLLFAEQLRELQQRGVVRRVRPRAARAGALGATFSKADAAALAAGPDGRPDNRR